MKLKARIVGWTELAPGVRHFDFQMVGDDRLVFTSGQFVSVTEHEDGKEVTRAYSIASPPNGNHFSLCLNRVDDGIVSPYLFSLEPNAEVEIEQPLGYFTLRRPERRAVFVATGTGIAPFRSILLDHLPKGSTDITLLFGARYLDTLLYREELERLAALYPRFRFLPTITRPAPDWSGRTGRVQQHLDEALDLHEESAKGSLDVYICGMKEMVDEVRALLKERGFDRKQIIYEKYD